jgi:hypothetical protein
MQRGIQSSLALNVLFRGIILGGIIWALSPKRPVIRIFGIICIFLGIATAALLVVPLPPLPVLYLAGGFVISIGAIVVETGTPILIAIMIWGFVERAGKEHGQGTKNTNGKWRVQSLFSVLRTPSGIGAIFSVGAILVIDRLLLVYLRRTHGQGEVWLFRMGAIAILLGLWFAVLAPVLRRIERRRSQQAS